jgi:FkbH-like protein
LTTRHDSANLSSGSHGDPEVVKVLLLSNVTMWPLVPLLKPWTVVCGAFNSMLADLATAGSPASEPDISHVLCLYDSDALMGEARYGAGPPEQCEAFLSALDGFCARHPDKTVVANSFCLNSGRWLGFADVIHPHSLRAAEAALNARLIEIAAARPNLVLIDLELIFRRHGEETLISDAFWYAGRIRYSGRMFDLLAETLRLALVAHAQKARKVLVLDLDNTLWGGVVGEAGPFGIALSEDGLGRCYRDFQRCLKAVQRTGVLLAISSKNNQADVDEVFELNPMMILEREDFAAIRVNWQPKPDNIAAIAAQLMLGTDSFVFIDDNPVEREAVAASLPGIAVPAFPDRIERLPAWLLRDVVPVYFGKYAITEEDAGKTAQYRANRERQHLAASFDLDSFLAELRIECAIHVDERGRMVRAAQMTQKTNQFNLTTRRYEVTDLARFMDSPKHSVLMLDYRDRFGDEGSVGLAILDLAEGRIDTFLASCRVIGRKVEDRLLDKAAELVRAQGHGKIVGEYIPTRKNGLAASFYETHGFTLAAEHPDGRKIYERPFN